MNVQLFQSFSLKINVYILIFSFLVFLLLIKLAFWQLDRAEHKESRLDKIALYQQQVASNLRQIMELQISDDVRNDLPVSLTGTFNNQKIFLLDNQVYRGSLGYRVVQLFEDERSNLAVLVNLGWVQGSIDRDFIPEIPEISGLVSFRGHIRNLESSIQLSDEQLNDDIWPQRIQSVDIGKIVDLLEKPLLPFIIYVDNEEALGYIKDWVPIVMSPEKHRGYAFQWFSLAAAWLILMLFAAYKSALPNIEDNN